MKYLNLSLPKEIIGYEKALPDWRDLITWKKKKLSLIGKIWSHVMFCGAVTDALYITFSLWEYYLQYGTSLASCCIWFIIREPSISDIIHLYLFILLMIINIRWIKKFNICEIHKLILTATLALNLISFKTGVVWPVFKLSFFLNIESKNSQKQSGFENLSHLNRRNLTVLDGLQ